MSYTAQKGGTLYELANRYNTTVAKTAKDNTISNPNKIYTGQTLKLVVHASPEQNAAPSTSTVQPQAVQQAWNASQQNAQRAAN
jgi:LysM repeat protein